jgi:hypothetical protein
MEDKDAVLKALQECDRKLGELKQDEVLVSEAETAFGELAKTVESVLQERRVLPDRRAVVRSNHDRRRPRGGTT